MKLTLGNLLIITTIVFTLFVDFIYIVKFGNPFISQFGGYYQTFVYITLEFIIVFSLAWVVSFIIKHWNTEL